MRLRVGGTGTGAELRIDPHAYPYGGVGPLIALAEAFGFTVLDVNEYGKYRAAPGTARLSRRATNSKYGKEGVAGDVGHGAVQLSR